jgi:hypothetical protein
MLTKIIHNQARTSLILCRLRCDTGPRDIAFGRSSLGLTELSQSKSCCGNRYAWCTLYCVNGSVAVHELLRELLRQSEAALVRGWYIPRYSICVVPGVIYCYDIWHLTVSVSTAVTLIVQKKRNAGNSATNRENCRIKHPFFNFRT